MGFEKDAHGKPWIDGSPECLYGFGHLIRLCEELILDQFRRGLVSGTTHTCIGQELCQMSVVRALSHPEDIVLSNHRNHGHFLTYSGDFTGLVAEVMGRDAGVCGGRGGSQHIAYRHFHSNGVQGGMTAIGVGEALAIKLNSSSAIVACMVGDGTLGEGLLYEALNLASIWSLPILFVVENNGIAQTTPTAVTTGGSIVARGEAFGLQTWQASDDSPYFFDRVEEIVAVVRRTRNPGFLVIDTRRLGPHSKGDDLRDQAEMEAIRKRDPLTRLGARLPPDVRTDIEADNRRYMETVRAEAERSPAARFSSPPAHIFSNAPRGDRKAVAPASSPGQNVRSVLNAKLRDLLTRFPEVVLLGEDLHDPYGGAFKVTAGLSTDFPCRVLSSPISEAAIVGAGAGLAMAGYRPICELMFADFVGLSLDQLYNHAVKFCFLFPEVRVPLVVRTPSGGGRGYGPTHSQSPENLLTTVPGLTVISSSHRHDNAVLLENAVTHWPYPTVFLEHKLVYGLEQSPGAYEEISSSEDDAAASLFPMLCRRASGPDVTVVTYGGMLTVVEEAAAVLEAEEELSVEIVALSLLSPLPKRTLVEMLAAARRIAIVEESHSDFGVGAEIAASLLESGTKAKVVRVGTPPVPIPSARSLEADVIPGKKRIVAAILALL